MAENPDRGELKLALARIATHLRKQKNRLEKLQEQDRSYLVPEKLSGMFEDTISALHVADEELGRFGGRQPKQFIPAIERAVRFCDTLIRYLASDSKLTPGELSDNRNIMALIKYRIWMGGFQDKEKTVFLTALAQRSGKDTKPLQVKIEEDMEKLKARGGSILEKAQPFREPAIAR